MHYGRAVAFTFTLAIRPSLLMLTRGAFASRHYPRRQLGLQLNNHLRDRCFSSSNSVPAGNSRNPSKWTLWLAGAAGGSIAAWALWNENKAFRHTVHATVRCSRVGGKNFNDICQKCLNEMTSSSRCRAGSRGLQVHVLKEISIGGCRTASLLGLSYTEC